MRARSFFISTLKEAPSDADIVSQQLMIRAGMIKKLAAGVYTYMPMGLRSLRKIENIIREEMNRAGAIELLLPMVQPPNYGKSLAVGKSMVRNFCALKIVINAIS